MTDVAKGAGSAIRMRGFVERFRPLTAVDGLDLDVPFGACVGLLRPNGREVTRMTALTAPVIADEVELELLGDRLSDDSKQACAEMGSYHHSGDLSSLADVIAHESVADGGPERDLWLARPLRVSPVRVAVLRTGDADCCAWPNTRPHSSTPPEAATSCSTAARRAPLP